jgi:hypothetical protein
MNYLAILFAAYAVAMLVSPLANAQVGRIEDSPYTIENSRHNPNNSQYMYRNSEMHPDNLKYRMDADNIIRDESGDPMGYSVEKEGGGTNFFLYGHGGRFGYKP